MMTSSSGGRGGATVTVVAVIAVVALSIWTLGGPWITTPSLAQTLGERVAAQGAQIDAQAKALESLEGDSKRIAALERSSAALEASSRLIISGLLASLTLLITILGIIWKASGKIRDDAQHIRATGHRLTSFMEAARQVPDLAEKVDSLPCMPGMRCPKPNGSLHWSPSGQEGD